VRDLLCADRQRRPLFLGHGRRALNEARAKLRLVGAERVFDAPLGRLSGGESQRVLVALALLGNPDTLLLDEAVAGIDVAGEAMFCDLLVRLREEARLTIVLVSHEMSIVVQHTDHVVCLNDRAVQCEGDTLTTLTPANIERVFGYHAAIYEHGHEHRHPGHQHPHMPPPPGEPK
jgi:zinc transport system ATP-binding protein